MNGRDVIQPKTFDERMEDDCKARGVTSLLYEVPNGNCWLFVSKDEPDPKTAFLKGMIDVMITRGFTGSDGPVTVRRLTNGLIAPGKEVYWQVNGPNNEALASGYCGSEAQAAEIIKQWMLTN